LDIKRSSVWNVNSESKPRQTFDYRQSAHATPTGDLQPISVNYYSSYYSMHGENTPAEKHENELTGMMGRLRIV